MTLTLGHFLSLGAMLFALSVIGIFLNRRNLIVLLMAIELMLLAVNMNFVAFSSIARIPPLNVACSRDMIVRWYTVSSRAPCAFIATSMHATATPSQHAVRASRCRGSSCSCSAAPPT